MRVHKHTGMRVHTHMHAHTHIHISPELGHSLLNGQVLACTMNYVNP